MSFFDPFPIAAPNVGTGGALDAFDQAAAIASTLRGFSTHPVPSPGPRWVSLQSENGTVIAKLLSVTPFGGGGIDAVARPQRTPVNDYVGQEAEGMTLELLMDGHARNHSVEPACRLVEQMAGMFNGGQPPQELIVSGPAIPHGLEEASQNRWLIADQPDWSNDVPDGLVRRDGGDRVRQKVTLTLHVVNEPDALERVKPKRPRPNYRLHVANSGDTFEKIAKSELGTPRLGGKLMRLNRDVGAAYFNHWRDPSKRIREGTQVRLPTAHELKKWKADLKAGK
jgi:hypothetical protein